MAALYYIGMMHFKGQAGLKKDPVKAIKLWRRVAAEKPFRRTNGQIKSNLAVSDAENAIGDAFRHGIGVKQDDVEAYNWYERSGKHGSPSGMINFASFRAAGKGGSKESLFARILFRRASRILYGDEEADEREDVSEDETAVHFSVFAKLSLFRSPVKAKRELHNKKVMAQMMEKRLQGWPTAKSYFQAYDAMNEASEMLADEKYHESFKKLREIWRTWDFAFTDYRPFLKAARRVLKSNPEDHGALYVIAIAAPEDDFKEKLKLILKCLQLDPSVPDYHLMAAHLYAMNDNFEIALKFCDKALELLPHPSWLFTRAHLLQLVGPKKVSVKKMIEAFQLYLSSVPSDYSDVAEAYYSIAWLLGYNEEDNTRPISSLEKTVFDMGRYSENVRLPCFRPVEIYGAEVYFSQNLMGEQTKNMMAGKETESKLVELLCACCTKTESLFSCITCKKTYYCFEKCRKNNAIVHNIFCNK